MKKSSNINQMDINRINKEIERDRHEDLTIVKPLWNFINLAIQKVMNADSFKHFFVKMDIRTYNQLRQYKTKILYILKTVYGEKYDFHLYDDTCEFCMYQSVW